MKGRILLTLQISRSNLFPSTDFGRRQPARVIQRRFWAVSCATLIVFGPFTSLHLHAGEFTNVPNRPGITVPSDANSDKGLLKINPSSSTNIAADALIAGTTNVTTLDEMLHLYANSKGRTVLWPETLTFSTLSFTADRLLTQQETTTAVDLFFGLNGIALMDIGEKCVKAVPSADCQTSSNWIHRTEYLAHFRHLTYLKPNELIPILQPLSSGAANAILPLNAQQAVLLGDFPENVQRMQKVIQETDVAAPAECLSEFIPIKYANASEIASAIYIFRTNGVGRTPSLERMDKRLRSAGGKLKSAQVKFVADERNNSLLVYAGREDMKLVKEIVSTLDTVAAQILLEAVIIEINCSNGFSIDAIGNRSISWTTNFVSNGNTNAPLTPQHAQWSETGGAAGFYRCAAISNDLESCVTMLATNKSVRILQRPRIQTSDGEPAQLLIGEAPPFSTEICGIQMISVGVTLEVAPSITSNGIVALDIHQTIEQANGNVTIANVGDVPITSRTERSEQAIVSNGSVIVLDGFLERTNATPRPGTFKRILTLNGLFHHSKTVTNQNELIVLLRPTILPTPEVTALSSKAEKDRMPRVRRAELETQTEAANRLKQLNEKLKSDRDQYRK